MCYFTILTCDILESYDPIARLETKSDYLFNGLFVTKPGKTDEFHLVVNFVKLNKRIIKDLYPVPNCDNIWKDVKLDSKFFFLMNMARHGECMSLY